jgi:hypothetical protein
MTEIDAGSERLDPLWPTDTGTLPEGSRRALVTLIKGPYLSRDRSRENWGALISDEVAIRSRLADLFLDLVIDTDAEVAFVRNAPSPSAPSVVRSEALTFMDTAMLLALRHTFLGDDGRAGRVIIGQDELYETLSVYRTPDRDEVSFRRNLNASWQKMMNKLRVIHAVGEDRAEISPVIRILVDPDRVAALRAVYAQVAAGGLTAGPEDDEQAEGGE